MPKQSELKEDLQLILDELDAFQSKVENSDDSSQANAMLEEDFKRILLNLDVFQKKIEEADEYDIRALKGMLSELQDKLMFEEEIDGGNSLAASSPKEKGATAEEHLELYMHRRVRNGTRDLPQAILLQNSVKQKQQNESKSWFHNLLFQRDTIEPNWDNPISVQNEVSKKDIKSSPGTLASNAKLKEDIVCLEGSIAQMDESHRTEINTLQIVIRKLERKNTRLEEKIRGLKQKQEENGNILGDVSAYMDYIDKLQKENVQLHHKVEFLSSFQNDDLLGDPLGCPSLDDSYSKSPSLKEMTNRLSSTGSMKEMRRM